MSNLPSIAASATALVLGDELALAIAGREELQHAGGGGGDDADAQGDARVRRAWRPSEEPVGADGGDDEGAGHDGGAHGVRVLPEGPGVEQVGPGVGELERARRRRRACRPGAA